METPADRLPNVWPNPAALVKDRTVLTESAVTMAARNQLLTLFSPNTASTVTLSSAEE